MQNEKKRTDWILKIAAGVCVLIFAVGVLIYGFSTGFGLSDLLPKPENSTESEQTYVYEETPRSLREIRVDWLTGPVTLAFHGEDTIKVIEKAGRALKEDEKLLMELSGGELNVHWNSSWLNVGALRNQSKSLEILIPRSFYEKLDTVRIYTVSGNVMLKGLEATEVRVETVSGEITLADIKAEAFRVESTSGSITCENVSGTEEFRVHTISGEVQLTEIKAGETKLDTTSGDMVLTGRADTLECTTVSGDVDCTLNRWPEMLQAESVSGDLAFALPEDKAGFLGKFDTVSGNLTCDFETEKRDKLYLSGEGAAEVKISTTSGDAALTRRGE